MSPFGFEFWFGTGVGAPESHQIHSGEGSCSKNGFSKVREKGGLISKIAFELGWLLFSPVDLKHQLRLDVSFWVVHLLPCLYPFNWEGQIII